MCAQDVKDYINKELPDAVLLEAHYNQLRYQLSMSNLKLDKVFSSMESAKQAVIVEDYSLSQTTLEEVINKSALFNLNLICRQIFEFILRSQFENIFPIILYFSGISVWFYKI